MTRELYRGEDARPAEGQMLDLSEYGVPHDGREAGGLRDTPTTASGDLHEGIGMSCPAHSEDRLARFRAYATQSRHAEAKQPDALRKTLGDRLLARYWPRAEPEESVAKLAAAALPDDTARLLRAVPAGALDKLESRPDRACLRVATTQRSR